MRDVGEVNLFSQLAYDCFQSSLPIFYFVDTFRALENNQYWIAQRNGRGDIVVDRHCNIVSLTDLVATNSVSHIGTK